MTHATSTARTGTQWACFRSRRPATAVNPNPANGRTAIAGIKRSQFTRSCLVYREASRRTSRAQGAGEQRSEHSQSYVSEPADAATPRAAVPRRAESTASRHSSAHRVVFVDERRLLVSVDGDHDGEADG